MKIFRRKKFESDMDVELGFHVDAYIDDLVRSGIDRTEAKRRARIELAACGGMNGLRTRFSKPLTALLILAGLVLLASCVTVANLMLARVIARQREFAIRLAIGAKSGRLIRQTLTEALVLVGAGSALGIVVARLGEAALASFFAEGNDKIILDLSLNRRSGAIRHRRLATDRPRVRTIAGLAGRTRRSGRRIAERFAKHRRKPNLAAPWPCAGGPAGRPFHCFAGRRRAVHPQSTPA